MAWIGLNGSVLDADMYRIYRSRKLKIITAQDVWARGVEEVVGEAMEVAADGADAAYISIDIDVVDGSQAPGTGVPVFEGIDRRRPHPRRRASRRL